MSHPPTLQVDSLDDLDPLALLLHRTPATLIRMTPDVRGTAPDDAIPSRRPATVLSESVVLQLDPGVNVPAPWLQHLMFRLHQSLADGSRILLLADAPLAVLRRHGLRNVGTELMRLVGAPRSLEGRRPVVAVRSLAAAGFSGFKLLGVRPSAADPRILESLGPGSTGNSPSFLLAGHKGLSVQPNRIDELLSAVRCRLVDRGEFTMPLLRRLYSSPRGKSIAIAGDGRTSVVVRIPRSPMMMEDEARSHALLEHLYSRTERPPGIPRPIARVEAAGLTGFVQECIDGQPLSAFIDRKNRRHYLAEVERFLVQLNPDVRQRPDDAVLGLVGASVGGPMIPYVLRHVARGQASEPIQDFVQSRLQNLRCPMGVVHGDLGTSNVLVRDGNLAGIIDWEASRDHGPPVLDAINYVESVHRSLKPSDDGGVHLVRLAAGQWQDDDLAFLRRVFLHCGADFTKLRDFVLLYVIFHVGPQLRFRSHREGPLNRLIRVIRALMQLQTE